MTTAALILIIGSIVALGFAPLLGMDGMVRVMKAAMLVALAAFVVLGVEGWRA